LPLLQRGCCSPLYSAAHHVDTCGSTFCLLVTGWCSAPRRHYPLCKLRSNHLSAATTMPPAVGMVLHDVQRRVPTLGSKWLCVAVVAAST
jgi:hypothetical protein